MGARCAARQPRRRTARARGSHQAAQAEYKRLQDRINAMYVDKLDGLIDTAFFDKMSDQWREEQNRCQREIDRHQSAEQSYMDEGFRFSNWLGTPSGCSSGRNRARNAACSISCYRTAPGRTAKWSPPSANHLIYWRKPPQSQPAMGRGTWPIRRKVRFGCPERISNSKFRDARGGLGKGLTANPGAIGANFHRRKKWTSTANGARRAEIRAGWPHPGSYPAGDAATAGLRW